MIVVVDTRRPMSLGVDVALQLETFVEHSRALLCYCCALGHSGAVEMPQGLIVPTSSLRAVSAGKMVQVVGRGRPLSVADVSSIRMVDIEENVYGDGSGWKFLIDATLTATRVRDKCKKIVVITTDLMLAGEDFGSGAERFFSETSDALRAERSDVSISMVFVEVLAASGTIESGKVGTHDSFLAWEKLHDLRRGSKEGAFVIDLISNTPAMFDSQLRCWLRESCTRQAGTLRLPATETFSSVVVEVEILPYLLDRGGLTRHCSAPVLHRGFSRIDTLQGIDLKSLDQGLSRGDPLLCIPSTRLRGPPQHSQANRKLFTAICSELDDRDMGLLLSVRHPWTSLQERWLLMPMAPVDHFSLSGGGGPDADCKKSGKALLIRLAMKEDLLEDETACSASSTDNEEADQYCMERAAACASIDMLSKGTYNPLRHSSGLLEYLTASQQENGPTATTIVSSSGVSSKTSSGRSQTSLSQRVDSTSGRSLSYNNDDIRMGVTPSATKRAERTQRHRPVRKTEISLRYGEAGSSSGNQATSVCDRGSTPPMSSLGIVELKGQGGVSKGVNSGAAASRRRSAPGGLSKVARGGRGRNATSKGLQATEDMSL